jgi:phosphatidylserine/phosphatidylglycerophosphate/cardiolipin synthase-like enzyme
MALDRTYSVLWYCNREMYRLRMSFGSFWRCLLAAIVAAALVVGCAQIQASAVHPPQPAPLLGPAPPVTVGSDQVALLRSGQATFARIDSLIDAARVSVHVEVYEFGQRGLAAALIAASSRGVSVTVIDDPTELASVATASLLRTAGVDVVDYPVRKLMIDHVKLLVIDAAVAVVGGINWGVSSPANHDYDAEVRGPVVHNLERVFARDLVTCGRAVLVPDVVADASIAVAATLPGTEIRPLALGLIDGARHALDLELFVLTDTGIVHALEAAALRGVSVRVLLDPSQPSSGPSFAALQSAGIQVRWYRSRGELLHAKAIVADGISVLFGSANWSGGGFARNHELDIELIAAPVVAGQMLAQMALNWAASA